MWRLWPVCLFTLSSKVSRMRSPCDQEWSCPSFPVVARSSPEAKSNSKRKQNGTDAIPTAKTLERVSTTRNLSTRQKELQQVAAVTAEVLIGVPRCETADQPYLEKYRNTQNNDKSAKQMGRGILQLAVRSCARLHAYLRRLAALLLPIFSAFSCSLLGFCSSFGLA